MKLSRIILKSKCTVSERKIFLGKEKKNLVHLHKQLKPATHSKAYTHEREPINDGLLTRGILLPENAPWARSGSKFPSCVPKIS